MINLAMFIWFKRRARSEARLGSSNPYEQLHNEVSRYAIFLQNHPTLEFKKFH